MPALNGVARTAPDARDLTTFSGAPVAVTLTGPVSIYRLLGVWKDTRTGLKAPSNPLGVFWFSRSVVDVLREDFIDAAFSGDAPPNPAESMIRNVREGLAVSYEWNSFDSLIELSLPRGASLHAWSGLTGWQLEYQAKPAGRLLGGGLVQYLVYDAASIPGQHMRRMTMTGLWAQFSREMPAQASSSHRASSQHRASSRRRWG